MTQPLRKLRMALEKYVEFERDASVKHEFCEGEIFAMSGGTPEHSFLATSIAKILGNRIEAEACVVFNSDLTVYVEENGVVTLP